MNYPPFLHADEESQLGKKDNRLTDEESAELGEEDGRLADEESGLGEEDGRLADEESGLEEEDGRLADEESELGEKESVGRKEKEEEKRQLELLRTLMEEKGSLEQSIMHCLFLGYPETGKSSLIKRLTGQPAEYVLDSASTGVAEKAVQVQVHTSAAMVMHSQSPQSSGSKWLPLDYNDEVGMLLAKANQRGIQTEAEQSCSEDEIVPKTLNNSGEQPAFMEVAATTSQQTPQMGHEAFRSYEGSKVHVPAANVQILPLEVLKQALERRGYKELEQYLKGSLTLYLTDTGGQLEFQELLPALTAGPTLFFIVFRLDQDLDDTVTIEYRHPDGYTTEARQSCLTVRETLLQSLASIGSMGTYMYIFNKKQGDFKQVLLKPRVSFIGTHFDQVTEERRKEIDCKLQEIVKKTALYHDGLIEFKSSSELLVAVNNFHPDDSHFDQVRSLVERIARNDIFIVSLPSTWIVLGLIIRQLDKDVISYDECFAHARVCGIITPDELNKALQFLGTVGLVRYFQGEGLKDLEETVIIDPQILFNKITQLIVSTFTFPNVAHHIQV